MRVICDNCPALNLDDRNTDSCNLKYDVNFTESYKEKLMKPYYGSDSCRLVKIVTLDGEIYPEPIEEVKK